jgi:hypothetical protein
LVVATGYEYEDPSTFRKTPRLGIEELVFSDTFASPLTLLDEDSDAKDKDDAAA